jgi:hypothetical protein
MLEFFKNFLEMFSHLSIFEGVIVLFIFEFFFDCIKKVVTTLGDLILKKI